MLRGSLSWLIGNIFYEICSFIVTYYSYDNNGNIIGERTVKATGEEIWTYRYDNFNQLIEITNPHGTTSFTYYPSGLRETKSHGREVTKYYYDGQNILWEEINNKLSARNIFGIGAGPAIRQSFDAAGNKNNYYYIYNGHGDVIALVDKNGNIINDYEYDIYGESLKSDETVVDNPFRYAGQYYDKETGLYYLRARYYDPEMMRFISEDINRGDAKDPLSLNLYAYCEGNPIMFIDADGHCPLLVVTALAGVVIGGVSGAIYSYSNYGEVRWQNVATGAAIGGVIGLTGGATTAYIVTGSATASTGAVITGFEVATTTGGTGVAIGTQFGKLGELVKNPKIVVDWAKTTAHGLQRMAERGVTQEMVETWMKSGQVLKQSGEKFLYVSKQGAVVVNKAGQVITAYTNKYFDENMIEIVKKLFGELE